MIGFLESVNSNNLDRATEYLDTKLPPPQAEELAKQLKAVLDTGLSSGLNALSHMPQGDTHDYLRLTRERVGIAKIPNGQLEILLDHVKRSDEPTLWLFSSETLAQIPAAYAQLHESDFSAKLPRSLVRIHIFGLPLWRILLIFASIASAALLSLLIANAMLRLLEVFLRKRNIVGTKEGLLRLKIPVILLILSLALWILTSYSLSVLARHYWSGAASILGIVGVAWFLARIAAIFADLLSRHSLAVDAREKIAVITLIRRLFNILAFLIAALLLLKGAGVNVSAMLAGLGIGGIALALAAQKTLEDLFGGISIIMRESIRVGDYCKLADQSGTIEDIGLSATRLRTLDRTVVSIPNSKIAQISSENVSLRDKFWFHHTLSLHFETSPEQVNSVLKGISALLDGTPEIEQATSRVNLTGFNQGSFTLEAFAYINAAKYEAFLSSQEAVLLQIVSLLSEAGVHLALPSQITYLEQGSIARSLLAMPGAQTEQSGPNETKEQPRQQ